MKSKAINYNSIYGHDREKRNTFQKRKKWQKVTPTFFKPK